jgi:hypothetical protein
MRALSTLCKSLLICFTSSTVKSTRFLLISTPLRSPFLPGLVLEAKKRFALLVLDYIVASNHIHVLIKDTGPNVISNSI